MQRLVIKCCVKCWKCSVRLFADILSHREFRVALHEDANRMNASALAIVFAPCILRTNKIVPAQDSLHDIGRQTQCIETIVSEQLRKVRSTLADIDTLDTACHTATHRLSSLRSSKVQPLLLIYKVYQWIYHIPVAQLCCKSSLVAIPSKPKLGMVNHAFITPAT